MEQVTREVEVGNDSDVIDVRDVIARVEELESDVRPEDQDELNTLNALLDELRGNGGDEEWRGAWYPITLIRATYFRTYAEELAEDIGAINNDAGWPNNHIDWEAAADELLVDYGSVDYDGVTYYYR